MQIQAPQRRGSSAWRDLKGVPPTCPGVCVEGGHSRDGESQKKHPLFAADLARAGLLGPGEEAAQFRRTGLASCSIRSSSRGQPRQGRALEGSRASHRIAPRSHKRPTRVAAAHASLHVLEAEPRFAPQCVSSFGELGSQPGGHRRLPPKFGVARERLARVSPRGLFGTGPNGAVGPNPAWVRA